MLAKTPLKDLMIEWLRTRDPAEKYNWLDPENCACGKFAASIDQSRDWIKSSAWMKDSAVEWEHLDYVARGQFLAGKGWTMGEFLTRLLEDA